MDYQVVLGATCGRISGVDIFSIHLARGLRERGVPAHILLTNPSETVPDPLPFPPDIPVEALPVRQAAYWPERWRAAIRYLEERAPCIYIPNYDWYHSCVSPRLSERVAVVGIVHSDDPDHYNHVARLGEYWNSIVSVSPTIASQVKSWHPGLTDRLTTIPYGVEADRPRDDSTRPGEPLRIVYAGRLVQYQKRVLDLPAVVAAARQHGVAAQLDLIGGGPDEAQLREACAPLVAQGAVRFLGILPNAEVLRRYRENDVIILTSDFEGMPVSLLEAMGQGCVPVVSAVRSGVPDLIEDGVNGFVVPIGDVDAFVERLGWLQRDPDLLRRMSRAAFETVRCRGFTVGDMTRSYIDVFERVWADVEEGTYRRPPGDVVPLPWMKPVWKYRIHWRLRKVGGPVYRFLARSISTRQQQGA